MGLEDLGTSIRLFLRNLLGSRLSSHLEEELMRLRNDYETRLQDRERTISDLREQLALLSSKVDRYELVLLPLSSPAGQFFAPKKEKPSNLQASTEPPPSTWEQIRADWDRQQAEEAAAERVAKEQ